MTGKKSHKTLEREYGRRIMEQSLTVCSALTKAVEINNIIPDIGHRSPKSPEGMEKLLSIADDDDSEMAREQAKNNFEHLVFNNAESTKEYIARGKFLATNQCTILWYGSIRAGI